MAVQTTFCPVCGKTVEVTKRGHIKPHVESKTAVRRIAAAKK
jgi:uncharacterized Zn finger protein (UPF0148 family)